MLRPVMGVLMLYKGLSFFLSTPEHPFWVSGKWIEAQNLQTGDLLITLDGKTVAIKSVLQKLQTVPVYNFEVATAHNYFVSGQQILVHNADCNTPSSSDSDDPFSENEIDSDYDDLAIDGLSGETNENLVEIYISDQNYSNAAYDELITRGLNDGDIFRLIDPIIDNAELEDFLAN